VSFESECPINYCLSPINYCLFISQFKYIKKTIPPNILKIVDNSNFLLSFLYSHPKSRVIYLRIFPVKWLLNCWESSRFNSKRALNFERSFSFTRKIAVEVGHGADLSLPLLITLNLLYELATACTSIGLFFDLKLPHSQWQWMLTIRCGQHLKVKFYIPGMQEIWTGPLEATLCGISL
jgi:hypothetical protein